MALVDHFEPEESRNWSLQYLFDRVRFCIEVQGRPSVGEGGKGCMYRSHDGIPDDEPGLGDLIVFNPVVTAHAYVFRKYFDEKQRPLLRELQIAHDSAAVDQSSWFLDDFDDMLRRVAHRYDLQYWEPLEELSA